MPSRRPLSFEVAQVKKMLMYTLLFLLVGTAGYFFFKTSYTAERGYSFRETQTQQKTLESENRLLKQRVLDAQSMNELQSSEVVKKMISPAQPPVFVAPRSPLTRGKIYRKQSDLPS